MSDSVNHPTHYNQGPLEADGTAKYEVIKIIEALGWGFPFCMGNALKYVLRSAHKGAAEEDLKKAKWYLQRALTADQFTRNLWQALSFVHVDTTGVATDVTAAWFGATIVHQARCFSGVAAVRQIIAGQPERALAALEEGPIV